MKITNNHLNIFKVELDHSSPYSIFVQLKNGLDEQIMNKNLCPGTKLPPIDEIAKVNNVSIWTVEKAIKELIKENVLYRRPKKGTYISDSKIRNKINSGNISFIIREQFYFTGEPFYSIILNSVQKELKNNGYNVVFNVIDNRIVEKYQIIDSLPEIFENKKIDGVIIAGSVETKLLKLLEKQKIPLVIIDYDIPEDNNINCVLIDNFNGTRMAAEYFIKLGHKRIGFIGNFKKHPSIIERINGYKYAMKKNRLNPEKFLYIGNQDDLSVDVGYMLAKKLLNKSYLPTAIICANDAMAVGTIKAIKEKGISVPEDISVIGFDDIEWAKHTDPPLTTIKVFKEKMGEVAAEKILKLVKGEQIAPEKIKVETELVIRNSCKSLL